MPRIRPIPEERVQLRNTARDRLARELAVVLARDEPWEDVEPARPDDEVVEAAAVLEPPQLHDPQPPAFCAVERRQLLHVHHAVDHALQQHVRRPRVRVVEEQDGAAEIDEALLQRQDLPAVAQPALGEQPQLGAGVEHDARRSQPVHLLEEGPHALAELDLRGLVERRLRLLRRGVARDLHHG